MPYQTIPGTNTRWRPADEALADPDYEWVQMPDGTIQGRRRPGFWTKAAPWLIGGAMGYGALSGAGLLPGLAGPASAAPQAAGPAGLLPSYGPTAAMQTAGATLPSVAQVTPAMAMGLPAAIPQGTNGGNGGAPGAANLAQGGRNLLDRILDYAPAGLAGAAALRGFMQPRPPAEDQLANILRMAEGRVQAAQPLFENLLRMTNAQLPKFARGEQ